MSMNLHRLTLILFLVSFWRRYSQCALLSPCLAWVLGVPALTGQGCLSQYQSSHYCYDVVVK